MIDDEDCEDLEGRQEQIEALELVNEMDIEERRRKVLTFRLQGLSMRDIAEKVGVSAHTVSKDLKAMRAHNIVKATQTSNEEHLGDVMTHFSELEKMALTIFYKDGSKDADKLKAIDLVRVIQSDKIKALKETGFLTPEQNSGKADGGSASVGALQELLGDQPQLMAQIAHGLIMARMSDELPMPVPESDIIDAEIIEAQDEAEDDTEED